MFLWLRSLLLGLGIDQDVPTTTMHEYSSACLFMALGEGKFLQLKHIGIRFHYLREKIEDQQIILKYMATKKKIAGTSTKLLLSSTINTTIKVLVTDFAYK